MTTHRFFLKQFFLLILLISTTRVQAYSITLNGTKGTIAIDSFSAAYAEGQIDTQAILKEMAIARANRLCREHAGIAIDSSVFFRSSRKIGSFKPWWAETRYRQSSCFRGTLWGAFTISAVIGLGTWTGSEVTRDCYQKCYLPFEAICRTSWYKFTEREDQLSDYLHSEGCPAKCFNEKESILVCDDSDGHLPYAGKPIPVGYHTWPFEKGESRWKGMTISRDVFGCISSALLLVGSTLEGYKYLADVEKMRLDRSMRRQDDRYPLSAFSSNLSKTAWLLERVKRSSDLYVSAMEFTQDIECDVSEARKTLDTTLQFMPSDTTGLIEEYLKWRNLSKTWGQHSQGLNQELIPIQEDGDGEKQGSTSQQEGQRISVEGRDLDLESKTTIFHLQKSSGSKK